MKKRTKFFDFVCFVLGPFVVVVSYRSGRDTINDLGIAIGVALICLGFLRVYWRKSTSPHREVKGEEKKQKDSLEGEG